MFRLLRFYSVTSCIIFIATIVALTLFYRQVTIHWLENFAESGNLSLAQALLNSVHPEFDAYLNGSPGDELEPPAVLLATVAKMTRNTSVESVKIYNRNGRVVFSTQADEIGASAADAPGFLSASNGKFFSGLTIRDSFTSLKADKDNLMHTYIPIQNGPSEPVLGVLEIHADMTHLIRKRDRVLFVTLAGTAVIMALLYAALCFVVRHAKNIIDEQNKTIRERTESLEILSEQLLRSEELRSKKIAIDLHEGLAQTLSAIKVNVECSSPRRRAGRTDAKPQESIVPVLQSAIHEVRTIATELWPSSLEDLGLLPTLGWFCREFQSKHPQIMVKREISLHEGIIPSPLKIVIYRIIESAFRNIAKHSNTDQIRFMLHLADGMIHLIIGDAPSVQPSVRAVGRLDPTSDPHVRFAEVKERTKLSGGAFTTTLEYSGGVTLQASWACAGQPGA